MLIFLIYLQGPRARRRSLRAERKSRMGFGSSIIFFRSYQKKSAKIAQQVEQGTENPCVGGSIPSLGTINPKKKGQYQVRKAHAWTVPFFWFMAMQLALPIAVIFSSLILGKPKFPKN